MLINPMYSVIVPVYNSEESLAELYDRIHRFFNGREETFEVIFVDDRSTDESWRVLKNLKESYPETITAVRLGKNFGQHSASLCGMELAKGTWMITIDDDLQVPPEEIGELIEAQKTESAELVYGYYRNKQHSAARNLGSSGLKTSSRLLHG